MMVVNLADIENGYGSSLPLVPLRSEQYEPVGTKTLVLPFFLSRK